MNAPHNPAQAHAWRRRTAAVFAAVGALIFSSGMVMITAPAANAADRVGVCHRTGGDSHPYTFQQVAANSTALQAHRDHQIDDHTAGEDKYWKSAGTWNGFTHVKGDFKPDYIQGDPGVPADLDTFRDWCLTAQTQTTVTLATLDITPVKGCGTYGSITKPEDTEYVVYAINASSWDHLSGTVVVTATLQGSADGFKGNTSGWDVADDELSATRTVDLGQHTDCPTGTLATLATPVITVIDDCGVRGSITQPVSDGADYTIDGGENWGVTEGEHTVTATLTGTATGFENPPSDWVVDGSTATYHVDLGDYRKCPQVDPATAVTPLAPTWVEATCDTNPSVDYTEVAGVAYDTTGTVAPGSTVTVTASTVGNHVFANGVTTSWSHTFHAKPSGAACDDPSVPPVPTEEPLVVTPNYPSADAATCSSNGTLNVPAQPEGVLMTQLGSVPGDVSFTFTPATGYVFPEGTDTDVTVTVGAKLTGTDCILGEESHKPQPTKSKPKPRDRGPVVLGTQAAVPTAVDAGLSGLPTTSVSMTGSPRLAQALVAGGLLLLVAGGSMGLGRRTRGAHES